MKFPKKKRPLPNVFTFFRKWEKSAAWAFVFITLFITALLLWVLLSPHTGVLDAAFWTTMKVGCAFIVLLISYKIISLVSLYWSFLLEKEVSKKAISESEIRYRSFFDNVNMGIITARDGKIVNVNPEFCKLIDYKKEELIGLKNFDFVYSDDIPMLQQFIQNSVKDCFFSKEITIRLVKKDGSILDALTFQTPLTNASGKENEIIISFFNLTPIRKAKEALIATESRYRSLFENALDGIFIFDTVHKTPIHCNQKMAEIFGIESTQLLKEFPDRLLPDFQSADKNGVHLMEQQQKPVFMLGENRYTLETHRPDGSPVVAEVNTYNLPRPDHHLSVSIYRDITEKKKQEAIIQKNIVDLNQKNADLEKYIERNLQLENFAHIASHDLKTPIRTIVSFSQLLLKKAAGKLNESEMDYLNFINKGAHNMQKLVADLLTYSNVNTQKNRLTLIKLTEVLHFIQQEFSIDIQENLAKINFHNIPKEILGDTTKIKQLFQNLISNAIKFKKPDINPIIDIKCREGNDYWYFSVIDNGIGIKPEFHEQIFILFKRLHGAHDYEGSGIGLSLCKKIVAQHFGTISVDSVPGEYTRFDFNIRKY